MHVLWGSATGTTKSDIRLWDRSSAMSALMWGTNNLLDVLFCSFLFRSGLFCSANLNVVLTPPRVARARSLEVGLLRQSKIRFARAEDPKGMDGIQLGVFAVGTALEAQVPCAWIRAHKFRTRIEIGLSFKTQQVCEHARTWHGRAEQNRSEQIFDARERIEAKVRNTAWWSFVSHTWSTIGGGKQLLWAESGRLCRRTDRQSRKERKVLLPSFQLRVQNVWACWQERQERKI